ncbi:MAG TPA: PAS domain S-box protein [Beijerinckiaceae bacterium]
MRTYDWAATPLGPEAGWPQSLRTALSIMLSSAFPTYLAWGPDLTSFYNDAYIPIMGDKPSGLGRPFPEVWPEVWDVIGPITERAMTGEASYFEDLPLTLRRHGGPEATWFSFSYSPILDEAGGVGGVLCTVHETTQRVRAESDLRRSKAHLQAAVDLVDVSPYTWDPATGALDWDARLKTMWGLSPDAQVTMDLWMAAIHPEDRARVEAAVAHCLDPRGDGVYHAEYRVIGIEDGVERWVSTHGRTVFEGGEPARFTGAALDITIRKRADTALRESEERFRQFAENSSNTLWIVNLGTMRFEYLNPAYESTWGEPRRQVLDDPHRWRRVLHPEDRERVEGALERVRLGEVSTEEFRIVREDGVVRWIRNTFFPIRDAEGQIGRAGGIAHDITRESGRFVYVVEAGEAFDGGVVRLLRDAGYRVRSFSSGRSFLEAAPALATGCVVLDICRSGLGGLRISRELKARRISLPVIVLGDPHGDVTFGVQAMKAGAADFLPVPCGVSDLLVAVASAAASTSEAYEQSREADRARRRMIDLSHRERAVLGGLMAGKTNKEIGRDMGLSPRTVEAHRARVMQHLGARTLSQAVQVAASAGFQALQPEPVTLQDAEKPKL